MTIEYVEEALFKEVYLNLIDNAIKYQRKDIETEINIGVKHEGNKKYFLLKITI